MPSDVAVHSYIREDVVWGKALSLAKMELVMLDLIATG